jgi:hypothetical protein
MDILALAPLRALGAAGHAGAVVPPQIIKQRSRAACPARALASSWSVPAHLRPARGRSPVAAWPTLLRTSGVSGGHHPLDHIVRTDQPHLVGQTGQARPLPPTAPATAHLPNPRRTDKGHECLCSDHLCESLRR